MRRFFKVMETFEDYFMVTALIFMCSVILFQIILRYIFGRSLSWPEETARFAQIWLIYIAVSACVRRGRHVRIDVLVSRLKEPLNLIFQKIALCVTISFLIAVFYLAVVFVRDLIFYGKVSPAMSIPIYLVALSIPVGIGLATIRSFGELLGWKT